MTSYSIKEPEATSYRIKTHWTQIVPFVLFGTCLKILYQNRAIAEIIDSEGGGF